MTDQRFEVVSNDDDQVHIYRSTVSGTFSVADGGGWLPGIYADEAAARLAPKIDIGVLERNVHWDGAGQGEAYRPVTLGEIQQWA